MIFRYPGGKRKLAKLIIDQLDISDGFTDVFVGGGSVLIEAAKRDKNISLVANDKDPYMAAFWRVVVGHQDGFDALRQVIVDTTPTIEQFNMLRAFGEPRTDYGKAFHAVFFNRTTFSGIHNAGPIGGKDQLSEWPVHCRYNGPLMGKRLGQLRDLLVGRLSVYERDFSEVPIVGAAYYDPPYYAKGKKLYPVYMQPEEHQRLADLLYARAQAGNWMLSYDDAPEVRAMYAWAHIVRPNHNYSILGPKTDHRVGSELFIAPVAALPLPKDEIKEFPVLLDVR